jgi:polysaccharide pyruvyl transferase WcaK-like protein
VRELLDQIESADFVIASRFHGVLLTLLLEKPLLALSYHPKVDELMLDTGQGQYCLQIHDFKVEVLKDRFLDLEMNAQDASRKSAERVHQYRNALEKQYEQIFDLP